MIDIDKKIGDIKTVGVSLRPYSPDLKDYYLDLKAFLKFKGIDTIIDKASASMIGVDGVSSKTVFEMSDLLLSIGGDGTLISLARRSLDYQKPILGVNLGNLGFLTDLESRDLKAAIERLLSENYRIDTRMVIKVTTVIDGKEESHYAVNDLVIKHKYNKMAIVNLTVNDVLANRYHGDALIVSTPTGSTGYNLSAGGPIVFPYAKNFIFTPICPHSLTQRSLVLPVEFDIELGVEAEDALLIIDGQDVINFSAKDSIKIEMAENFVQMVHKRERNFFKVVREKLNWGDR